MASKAAELSLALGSGIRRDRYSALQSSIHRVLGLWWPVGTTPFNHLGKTKGVERKYNGSTGKSVA